MLPQASHADDNTPPAADGYVYTCPQCGARCSRLVQLCNGKLLCTPCYLLKGDTASETANGTTKDV